MNDTIVSYIRTLVLLAVGWVAAQLVALGVDVDANALAGALVPIVTGLYYVAARWLEKRWPAFGWLLGLPKQPTYS